MRLVDIPQDLRAAHEDPPKGIGMAGKAGIASEDVLR